jgi:hypothetical protein
MDDTSHTDEFDGLSFEHRVRRLAARSAPPKPPPPKRGIARDLVLIGGIVAAVILLAPFGDVANPDFAEARSQTERLDAAYQTVWSGDASLETAANAEGLRVHDYPLGERTVSIMVHPEPTAAGTCYGLRMGGGFGTDAVRFAATDDCTPQAVASFEAIGSWSDILPSQRATTVWFVPALVALITGAAILSTNIVLKLLFR